MFTQAVPFQRSSCTEKLSAELTSLPLLRSKRRPLPAANVIFSLANTDASFFALSVNSNRLPTLVTLPKISPARLQLLALHGPVLLEKSFSNRAFSYLVPEPVTCVLSKYSRFSFFTPLPMPIALTSLCPDKGANASIAFCIASDSDGLRFPL